MSIDYYDRQGNPLTMMEWAGSFRAKADKVVKQDTIGDTFISTVWLGLDHQLAPDGPPLIFETMIFPVGSWAEEYMWRYSTEAEAAAHHDRVVEWVRAGADPETVPDNEGPS